MKLIYFVFGLMCLVVNVAADADSFSVADAGNLVVRVFGGIGFGLIDSADLWFLASLACLVLAMFLFFFFLGAVAVIKALKGGV